MKLYKLNHTKLNDSNQLQRHGKLCNFNVIIRLASSFLHWTNRSNIARTNANTIKLINWVLLSTESNERKNSTWIRYGKERAFGKQHTVVNATCIMYLGITFVAFNWLYMMDVLKNGTDLKSAGTRGQKRKEEKNSSLHKILTIKNRFSQLCNNEDSKASFSSSPARSMAVDIFN